VTICARVVTQGTCLQCKESKAAVARAEARVAELTREAALLRDQLREALKLTDLQGADLARWRDLVASMQPNRPERVVRNELQLAFAQVMESLGTMPGAANETGSAGHAANPPSDPSTVPPSNATSSEDKQDPSDKPNPSDQQDPSGSSPHGRRNLRKSSLPVQEITIDPDEVVADNGEGWELIGAESSEALAKQRGGYFRVRFLRRTWVRNATSTPTIAAQLAGEGPAAQIVTGALPECVWPGVMGDPSSIANTIVSKYDDSLPLNRQESITERNGFVIPRSTQCDWLAAAYAATFRVVDAMMDDGIEHCHVIATDATGAPVRARHECRNWHAFVFIMEHDHVVFRHSREHTGDAVRAMIPGFHGHLLADAAGIYDHLYRDHDVTEAGDWAHARRYFWKALPTDRARAIQGIAIIGKLFDVERDALVMTPDERLQLRRERSAPLVKIFDEWAEREQEHVDDRSPIRKAFGYYKNQREALHRFLADGQLPIHNNRSEAALRKLVLGRANWMWFENESGLKWYCTFRSLIASCALHGLNPETYLEGLLRLAPHWPTTRMLELSPRDWQRTVDGLDERGRRIITPPWRIQSSTVVPSRNRRGIAA